MGTLALISWMFLKYAAEHTHVNSQVSLPWWLWNASLHLVNAKQVAADGTGLNTCHGKYRLHETQGSMEAGCDSHSCLNNLLIWPRTRTASFHSLWETDRGERERRGLGLGVLTVHQFVSVQIVNNPFNPVFPRSRSRTGFKRERDSRLICHITILIWGTKEWECRPGRPHSHRQQPCLHVMSQS